MRENRTYGSEGGGAQLNACSLPLSLKTGFMCHPFPAPGNIYLPPGCVLSRWLRRRSLRNPLEHLPQISCHPWKAVPTWQMVMASLLVFPVVVGVTFWTQRDPVGSAVLVIMLAAWAWLMWRWWAAQDSGHTLYRWIAEAVTALRGYRPGVSGCWSPVLKNLTSSINSDACASMDWAVAVVCATKLAFSCVVWSISISALCT